MTNSQHVYEIRPRKDHRGIDLISDALPFGRLWFLLASTSHLPLKPISNDAHEISPAEIQDNCLFRGLAPRAVCHQS
jgi:hypothetical protein